MQKSVSTFSVIAQEIDCISANCVLRFCNELQVQCTSSKNKILSCHSAELKIPATKSMYFTHLISFRKQLTGFNVSSDYLFVKVIHGVVCGGAGIVGSKSVPIRINPNS